MNLKKHITLLLLVIPNVVCAQSSGYRDHAAHVHGHATLNVAISGNIMQLELESPAMNLLGFEHIAKSSQEKKHVHNVKAFLQNPDLWMKPEPSAGCQLQQTEVKSKQLNHEHHHEHDHPPSDGPQHSDFKVMVTYQCNNSERLSTVDLTEFFNRFNALEELDVQWINETNQSSTELNPRETIIRFD